jgi:hypothetical protein
MQRSNNASNNRRASIGAPRGLRRRLDHDGQIGVARRPQAERRGKQEGVIRHGLWPASVIGEGGGRDSQLRGQSTVYREVNRAGIEPYLAGARSLETAVGFERNLAVGPGALRPA